MGKFIAGIVTFFGVLFLFAFINAFIIKVAWQYSLTEMYNLAEPTYLQAFALSILTGSLFKSSTMSKS